MPSCATVVDSGAPISPSGCATPTTISTATHATKSGVSTLPMTVTTCVCRIDSASTTAKKTAENANMPTPSPNSGTMDISYVVAAVRGSAMTMPVHRMTAVFSTKPGTRPIDPSTAAFAPPAALSAKMPRHESTTSISTKHRKPSPEEHGKQRQSRNKRILLHYFSFDRTQHAKSKQCVTRKQKAAGCTKVSKGACGASYSAEASGHRPLGHARAAEVEDDAPHAAATSSKFAGRQAGET